MPQRNSNERREMLADRAEAQRARTPRFTPVAGKHRRSTRGERHGFVWHPTKKRTASRSAA